MKSPLRHRQADFTCPLAALAAVVLLATALAGEAPHWAWQPVAAVPAPPGPNPIDGFIASRLAAGGITPLPEADDRTLVRRMSFDLTGLPPTAGEVADFAREAAADRNRAMAQLVDRLLASPHYGERWARHWLDIAHYADTHGFERDQRRDHAWRYRDWVIRALNADLPYDEFLRLQIAGDVLQPETPDAIIATGFLAAGPWDFVGQAETPSPVLKRLARADDLDDMISQVMTAACAVTIHCARCHDHKLDPVPQREYYGLAAVFAGLKRGDREVNPAQTQRLAVEKADREKELMALRRKLARLEKRGLRLADFAGGGNGTGNGTKGLGIHPGTGKVQKEPLGFVEAAANRFAEVAGEFVDGVVIPNGDGGAEVQVSSTGLKVQNIPKTTGQSWDAIRNGPVNAQKTTRIGDVDFNSPGHSVLGIHANAAITFDLAPVRAALQGADVKFRAAAGYGGRPEAGGAADVRIFLDGEPAFVAEKIGPQTGRLFIDLNLPPSARFLTLMSTDGGDGSISHDQVFFGDAEFVRKDPPAPTAAEAAEINVLRGRVAELERQAGAANDPDKVYAVIPETPPVVRVNFRGSPEDLREEAPPGAPACITALQSSFGGSDLPEGRRRIALANWIASPENPLTGRVIVNRLWHHHFGTGLVDTPSDFGKGGGTPSHPELLDFLAGELVRRKWSLKALHRLICTSAAYRRASAPAPQEALARDAGNRLLWRGPSRRLDAESLRDSILAVSGKLNRAMHGPGWRDFDYREEYAPVYSYKTADTPDLWRRSIYRFVVRTTPHHFFTVLDCPNPASLAPTRNVTTTALQSLTLMNNAFILQQASHFAARVQAAAPDPAGQAAAAFEIAFARKPSAPELDSASRLLTKHGLPALCRMLFNANEFVVID